MFYRKRLDIIVPEVLPTGSGTQTIRFKIKQEPRRIESINFKLRLTLPAALAAGAAWGGHAGVVKEIRVRVDDVLGSRNAVQVSGIGLLGFVSQHLTLDRNTQVAYASSGFPVSVTEEISYMIPLRHPTIAEPFGHQLSLPLSSKFSNADVYVEVDFWDIGVSGTVFGATASSNPAFAASQPALLEVTMREVPDSVPYIPTELRSDTVGWASTSNVYYEFASSGYLTGFLMQGLSKTWANDMVRQSLLSTAGQFRLEYGRSIEAKTDEAFMVARNDLSKTAVYPNLAAAIVAAATLQARNFAGEVFWDFLTDYPMSDAYAINSVYPLDLDITGGDKMRVYINDLASTAYQLHLTYHKLLPKNRADLNGLVAGI